MTLEQRNSHNNVFVPLKTGRLLDWVPDMICILQHQNTHLWSTEVVNWQLWCNNSGNVWRPPLYSVSRLGTLYIKSTWSENCVHHLLFASFSQDSLLFQWIWPDLQIADQLPLHYGYWTDRAQVNRGGTEKGSEFGWKKEAAEEW